MNYIFDEIENAANHHDPEFGGRNSAIQRKGDFIDSHLIEGSEKLPGTVCIRGDTYLVAVCRRHM